MKEDNKRMKFNHHISADHTSYLSFFTLAKFLEIKIYTEKTRKLHSKLPIFRKLHSKLPIFRVKSVKIYTRQFFLHRHRLWCL